MGFDPADFDDDCVETINQMASALGTARIANSPPITGTKIGGKSKPSKEGGQKTSTDQAKKDLRDQMETMVLIFQNLLANTHDIMYLAEEEGLVKLNIDNWDFYSIMKQLDDNEIFVEMFGVSGIRVSLLLEKMSTRYTILKPVTINQLVRSKLNG
jgi:hypothetical protein